MIKSSELRIGNILKHQSGEIFIVSVDDIILLNSNSYMFPPLPVEISDEILLKFGFEKDSLGAFVMKYLKFIVRPVQYGKPYLLNGIDDKGYSFELSTDESWESIIRVKYVHQLQNLYFALTGSELNTSELTKND